MKITADTHLLCRIVLNDDPDQKARVVRAFEAAEVIVIVLASLCEVFWVLRTRYGLNDDDIRDAVRQLLLIPRIEVDRTAATAGLDLLDAGGDFSDGAIAAEGRHRGGETFMTFDRRAIRKLRRLGLAACSP